jgi:3-hydroxybutyrate dehydrogenase
MAPEAVSLAAHGRPSPDARGRVALLTGSTGGLGFAMAAGLAEAGCAVMLNGVEDAQEIEPERAELERRTGTSVAYCRANVGTLDGVTELLDDTLKQFGTVDILVNNAVVRHFGPMVDFRPEHWDAALAVNLSAAFHATRLVLPGMRQRNFGRIFNMTSVYGARGTVNRVDYVTTKSALIGLTRAVALENLDWNVTCHAICPGSVLTPGTEGRVQQIMAEQHVSRAEAERRFLEGKQPNGRFVPARSVIELITFLLGPIARDMTGSVLPVEAGWLAS